MFYHDMHMMQQSQPVLSPLVEEKKVKIYGAIYDLESGKVNFINDLHHGSVGMK